MKPPDSDYLMYFSLKIVCAQNLLPTHTRSVTKCSNYLLKILTLTLGDNPVGLLAK